MIRPSSSFAVVLFASFFCAPLYASERDCRWFYHQVDQATLRNGARDTQETSVKGYPYLRTNRFLASVAKDADGVEHFDYVLQQLVRLDQRARRMELSNLPAAALADLEQSRQEFSARQKDIPTTLDECAKTLLAVDRANPDAINRKVRAPDSYSLFKRLLGFYPVTAIPFSRGIRKFQAEMTQTYQKNLGAAVRDTDVVFHVPPLRTPSTLQRSCAMPATIRCALRCRVLINSSNFSASSRLTSPSIRALIPTGPAPCVGTMLGDRTSIRVRQKSTPLYRTRSLRGSRCCN